MLTVQFVDADASPCGLIGFHRLSAPSFPDNTSIESTIWKVTISVRAISLFRIARIFCRIPLAARRQSCGTVGQLRGPLISAHGQEQQIPRLTKGILMHSAALDLHKR